VFKLHHFMERYRRILGTLGSELRNGIQQGLFTIGREGIAGVDLQGGGVAGNGPFQCVHLTDRHLSRRSVFAYSTTKTCGVAFFCFGKAFRYCQNLWSRVLSD